MIIDCHGHYTTEPAGLKNFREQQVAAANEKKSWKPWSSFSVTTIIHSQNSLGCLCACCRYTTFVSVGGLDLSLSLLYLLLGTARGQ